MSDCPSSERLEGMLADQLDAALAGAVELHVRGCPACQQVLDRLTDGEIAGIDPAGLASTRRTHGARAVAYAALVEPTDGDAAITKVSPPVTGSGEPGVTLSYGLRSPTAHWPTVPGYQIRGEIGRGGMGVVYEALQLHAVRIVALKMVAAPQRRQHEDLIRFRLEGESLARLRHPNVVQVFEVGIHEGQPFFSMEYVDGGTLADALREDAYPPAQSAGLVESLARAMHAAHQCGIVHRDLKPANILLTRADTAAGGSRGWAGPQMAKVSDFGLAKELGNDCGLTHTGQILGTPSYMAPEQALASGKAVGIPADVYALGTILYELLAGRPPFRAETPWDTMMQVVHEPPAPPSRWRAGVPGDLDTVALKCLEKEPAKRYATADALAEDLRRFVAGEPILARPVSAWERAVKWARRKPANAAFAAALAVAILALAVQGVWSYRRISRALAAAEAQTYLATKGEADLLRLAHPTGWRDRALRSLGRLTAIDTPGRDLVELRSQAVACLGELDVREVARLTGSKGMIRSLDFSPDGRTLATASEEDDPLIWDLEGRRLARRVVDPALDPPQFRTPNAPWPSVRFRPGGGLLYATWDRSVAEIDSPGAGSPRTFATAPAPIRSVNLDREGRLVVVGWAYNHIGVFDAATGTLKRKFEATPMGVLVPVAVSPDGSQVASVGPGGEVQVHDLRHDVPPRGLGRLGIEVKALAYSPDGRALAAATMDGTVRVWDLPGGTERSALRGHSAAATGVAFSPDGTLIATIGIDQTARLWNARNGLSLQTLKPGIGGLGSVAFSPDGERLAVGSTDVCLYQLVGRLECRHLAGHFDVVRGVAFHPKKPLLASVSADTTAILWDGVRRQWGCNEGRQSQCVAWSPDGSLLATGANTYPLVPGAPPVILWEVGTGKPKGQLPVYDSAVRSLAFDASGRRLASGFEDGAVVVWDVDRLESRRQERLGGPVAGLAFLGDGSRLLAASVDGGVVLFDLNQEGPFARTDVPGGALAIVVRPGEGAVTVAGVDGGLRTLSLPNLKQIRSKPAAHVGPIHALALSPDGRLLVSGGLDRRVVFRDAQTLEPHIVLNQDAPALRLAFDHEGRRLAIAGEENEVTLWDLAPLRLALGGLGLDWGQGVKASGPRGIGSSEAALPWVIEAPPAPADVRWAALVRQGRDAAGKGRHTEADAFFAQAAALAPDDLQRFLDVEWWVVGLYPEDLRAAYAPESDPDPSRPVAGPPAVTGGDPAKLAWRSVPAGINSGMNFLGAFGGYDQHWIDHCSAYALTYVYAAVERQVVLSVGGCNDHARIWVNGRLVFEYTARGRSSLDHDQIPITLRAGRNTLLVKLTNNVGYWGIYLRIASDPAAFGNAFAKRGLWAEAAAALGRAHSAHPDDLGLRRRFALALVAAGDLERYRATCAGWLKEVGPDPDPFLAESVARSSALGPHGAGDREALVRLAGSARAIDPEDRSGRARTTLGAALYRAGRFNEAIKQLEQAAPEGGREGAALDRVFLAMAYARRGDRLEARRRLQERPSQAKPADETVDPFWDELAAELLHREARALVGQDP
jgi:WD40 repeat protein